MHPETVDCSMAATFNNNSRMLFGIVIFTMKYVYYSNFIPSIPRNTDRHFAAPSIWCLKFDCILQKYISYTITTLS
jgi:hypothetical protein